jgi:hypothetical protein
VAVAGSGALVALGSAGAYVGGAGSGPLPVTDAPDLQTATVTRLVDAGDPVGPQVKYCFDGPIQSATSVNFNVNDYDVSRNSFGSGGTLSNPSEPNCVTVTFPVGRDIEQYSTASIDSGGAVGNGGVPAPRASVPLTPLAGSLLGLSTNAVAGRTAAPDLVGAAQSGNAEITYTFDERLDNDDAGFVVPANFIYYTDSQNGADLSHAGTSATISRNTAIVQFGAAVVSPSLFAVGQGAVRDVDSGGSPGNMPSTIGSVKANASQQPTITGSPGLISAVKNSDNQSVNLTFHQGVNPGAATGVRAYREDGSCGGVNCAPPGGQQADSITTTNDSQNQILRATFPPDMQDDPAEVVRVAVDPTAATARSGANGVTIGAAAIGTCKCTIGYSNSGDLLSIVVHDDTNIVDFIYDEPLDDTPAPTPSNFRLTQPDGEDDALFGNTAVLSADRKTISVHFPSSVSATRGANTLAGSVIDQSPQSNTNGFDYGSVGVGPVQGGQTGSVPTPTGSPGATPTATTTVTPGVTPTVTPPQTTTVTRKSKISIKRKSKGRRYTGKVSAKSPCKSGRTVRLYRGSKRLKTTKTKSSGSYSFKVKKQKKRKIKARVSARTVTVGNVIYKCGSKTSRKV